MQDQTKKILIFPLCTASTKQRRQLKESQFGKQSNYVALELE